jgi:hypothetical protein
MKLKQAVQLLPVCFLATLLLLSTAVSASEPNEETASLEGESCRTQEIFEARYPDWRKSMGAACIGEGPCDNPATRDAYIPDPGDPPISIRLKFNVFAEDDGSNQAATFEEVDEQMAKVNADYLPQGFQFVYETEVINNSTYRSWTDAEE